MTSQAGAEGVGVGALAVALDLELDPGPEQRIVAVAERQAVHPAIAVQLDLAFVVGGADPAAGVGEVVVDQFVSALVRVGLTDEEEVGFEVADELAEGLAAVQVVAEEDGPEGAQFVAVGGQPALGGVAFAVLLAVLCRSGRRGGCAGAGRSGAAGAGRGCGRRRRRSRRSMMWKYCSVLCWPTWRVEHWSQWMAFEQCN